MRSDSKPATSAERQRITASDGREILIDTWLPKNPKAVIHLLHGLAEHPARYERFAVHCNTQDVAVAAHNHRGHGENCAENELGHYADEKGWDKVISDAALVQDVLVEKMPDIPLILLGHSMGSYIAQSFLVRDHGSAAAMILSGSTLAPRFQLRVGHWLAAFESLRLGKRGVSTFLNKMGFGEFNKRFAPNRTEFDWLSRDETEVDKYVSDPLCGVDSSSGLWFDLTGGFLEITSVDALRKIRSDLPVLITGGSDDPVGGRKGMTLLAKTYEKSGHNRITLKIYDQGRHEMFNETNRKQFFEDITNWISDAVPGQGS